MKKHNFNAGPSILADEVLENAAKAIIDFNGSGLSLLSISHRTKDFDDVMAEADALFRGLGLVFAEVGRRVLAQRADEISGERFALVDIAADLADPAGLLFER